MYICLDDLKNFMDEYLGLNAQRKYDARDCVLTTEE